MNTRDQFGNYLLLKRLAEDPLGETFRAGKIGRQNLERVVLLRVLNGSGFDAERVARALQARSALSQALKSPTIGQAIDVGQVRGVPYIAYDYASGRSLDQLLEQAGRRNSPLPLDHALLVAERIALALAVAHETRIGDERVLHGFVTPQLVLVTNEGELKLLGFEASTGLRENAAHPIVKQAVGRFLAPEALAGQPLAKSDDVYSVAALLLEMLTGQASAGQPGAIDGAVVAADQTPLPPELAALLKRSLCPRDQRVPDIVTWHKTVAKLMADHGWAATTFNLAFFLHSLYRDEIDREARELESEKSQAAAMVAAAAVHAPQSAVPAAPSAVRASGPVREDTNVLRDEYGIPAKQRGGPNPAVIGGAAAAVVALAVAGYFLFLRGGAEAPAPAAAPVEAVPAPAEPVQTGMTPEQIQELIAEALEQQRQQIEAGQKASDDQLKALQRQLEEAQRTRAASPPPAVQIAKAPAPATAAPTATASEPEPAAAAPTAGAPAATGTTTPPAAPTAAEKEAAATTPVPQRPTPTPAQTATQAPASQPVASTPAPTPAAPPATSAVRVGDLVTMGPGVSPPRVVRQPPLAYPQVARRLRKEATITVRVLVDERGNVSEVDAVGSKVGFGLDEAALSHARNCVWTPATKDGVKVKMWTDLRVMFKL